MSSFCPVWLPLTLPSMATLGGRHVLTRPTTTVHRSVFRYTPILLVIRYLKTNRYTFSMSDASTAAAPAAPRPRQRILTTARTLFYCEGIHATGVQRLADTPPLAGFYSGSTRRGCVLRRAPSAADARSPPSPGSWTSHSRPMKLVV
jgi:hypothetical protein